MPGKPAYVIAGASLAGAKAAQTLREEGFDGSVVLIGSEELAPYERPPLSKGFLLGKEEADSAYVHEEGWYAANDVDLRLGVTVRAIDRDARQLTLSAGDPVSYDKLLITTGASARRLAVPGGGLDGVLYLRSLADSQQLKTALSGGGRVVIAGAGWIGLETAAAAREYGCEVTIVEPESGALYRSVGPELGEVFAGLHRSHGVVFRFGEGVAEIRGSGGKVTGVVTSADEELPADLVIAAIGVVPNDALAAAAGLDTDNGIVADEALRTSDPGIFAAGDVANAFNPLLGRRIRVEHWGNALAGGPAAARSMLGRDVSYDLVPYFFSDQYDLGMEAAGLPEPGNYDQVAYRGDPETLEFIAFWLSDGAVVAGMNINVWDVNDDIQALIRAGDSVDISRLEDPDVPLTEL
ncbi:MAG TPA: FAD-dependent oxidoreductase [Streptosporangiaceae bacterium]|jgi:3-phenylpropionate/trans-cinnamate dioxygenase ferredoxin reductase subunit